MPTVTPQEDLGGLILATYEVSKFPACGERGKFSPRGELEKVMTEARVIQEISVLPFSTDQSLVDFILRNANRLFAISLLSGLRSYELNEAMRSFKHQKITNESLPFSEVHFQDSQYFPSNLWGNVRLENFRNHQWRFPNTLFSNSEHITLQSEAIFPFTESEELAEGGFGAVSRVTVHQSHLKPEDPIQKVRKWRFFL